MNLAGLFQLLNFAILAGVLVYFGKKPIQQGLEARSDEIARLVSDAEARLKGAKEALDIHLQSLEGTQAEVSEILSRANSMKENFKKEIQEAAAREAIRLKVSAQESVALETRMAIAALRREVVAQATARATRELASLDQGEQTRLVADFARKVGEGSFAK